MITITLEFPDEVKAVVSRMGTDLDSFVQAQVVRPLMDHLKAQKERDLVEGAQSQIVSEVADMQDKIVIDRKNFKTFVEKDKDGQDVEVVREVDDKGALIKKQVNNRA